MNRIDVKRILLLPDEHYLDLGQLAHRALSVLPWLEPLSILNFFVTLALSRVLILSTAVTYIHSFSYAACDAWGDRKNVVKLE